MDKGQAKTDACYISEIINDLERTEFIGNINGFKFGDMLKGWQRELMEKAGFKNINALVIFIRIFGVSSI
jgi:hypothetical protein